MHSDFKAAMAVIVTSAFWLFILFISVAIHNGYDINAYRQGYGEGKAGLPERWERAEGGHEIDKR